MRLTMCATSCRSRLISKGRLKSWVERRGSRRNWRRLPSAGNFGVDPQAAWLRVKGLHGLDASRARLLQELAAWRERARDRPQSAPRGWILDEGALREIVLRVPRHARAARRNCRSAGQHPQALRRGDLGCVQAADFPIRRRHLIRGCDRIRPAPPSCASSADINHSIALELGMSPEVLTTRRELEQLADGRRDVPVLQGWRGSVVGDRFGCGIVAETSRERGARSRVSAKVDGCGREHRSG